VFGRLLKALWRRCGGLPVEAILPAGLSMEQLIRKSDNGEVEVGPTETNQCLVNSVAYSSSGDRIASGGESTIRTWDSKTGEPLVSPVEDLRGSVSSIMIVWSSDGSKLYSSDNFARVFDSVSGTQLHRFENDKPLDCVALSSKHNVLACVG
jgi:WD40 repeat protein